MRLIPVTVGAFAGAAFFALLSAAAADPLLAPGSAPQETIGKAAAGKPKPYRSELLTDCDAATQCVLDFGKKQKVRTIRLVNCAAGVTNGVAVLSEVRVTDPDAVVGYMAVVTRAEVNTIEYSVHEYPHTFEVAGGRRLTVIVTGSQAMNALRCIVSGTIE
jgi:hypothetical protein